MRRTSAEAGRRTPCPSAIAFSGVSKRLERRPVLDDFTLEVRAGEIFGLVGTNGAGKTTCIKCLLDLCHVDGGRIEIFGRPASVPESRRSLVYLPERFLPPQHLRGREFLDFMARMHGVEPSPTRMREVLAALDLAPPAARPTGAGLLEGHGAEARARGLLSSRASLSWCSTSR